MKFIRFELRHTADPTCSRAFKGGSSSVTEGPKTTTTNTDNRKALQDSVDVGAFGRFNQETYNSDSRSDNRRNYDSHDWNDNSQFSAVDSRAFSSSDSRSFTDSNDWTDNSTFSASDSRAFSNSDSRAYHDSSTTTSYAADAEVLKGLGEMQGDAVRAMTNAGADVINRAGGSIVDLNRDSINANTKSFDTVVEFGAGAIDSIIDASVNTAKAGNTLAAQAVASFQPTEKNSSDAMKYAMFAAAGLVAVVLLKGAK